MSKRKLKQKIKALKHKNKHLIDMNPRFIREYERAGQLAGFTHKYQSQAQKSGMIQLMQP